jgi:cell division transport system permease protein
MSRGKKTTAKQFAAQKRKRRQWLTFVRMCRYGVNNFSRNAWLTVAATAMMTLTLFVVMGSLVARNVLLDSVAQIRDRVDMSIYIEGKVKDEDVTKMKRDIQKLEGVKRVVYVSPDEARTEYAKANQGNQKALDALELADVTFPGTFRINITDINNTQSLDNYVKNDALYKRVSDPNRKPSFEGDRRAAIESIGRWVSFAEKAGLLMSVILVTISSLIVFNTIRMAIFNRKEEIQMMKLIGADRGFIRGPFVVEAVVYGFIAAITATALGIAVILSVREKLESYGIVVEPTIHLMTVYIGFVLLGMIAVGALIGVISSLFATQRYLKI